MSSRIGRGRHERVRPAEQRLPQVGRTVDSGAVNQLPRCVHRRARHRDRASRPPGRSSPDAKPIGSMILWHEAQTGFARCASRRWRSDVALTASGSFSRFVSTPGGGIGAGVPSRFSRIHLAALHRRCPRRHRRHGQHAALSEQPSARAVRSRETRAGSNCREHRNAVVPREPFVDERIVGVDQIDDAPVFTNDVFETASPFRGGRPDAGCRRSPSQTSARVARSRR